MASKSANINVNINSNFQQAEKSSEDMRKRIRELRKEFYSLEEGTEDYNRVLAELSKLQLDYSDQTIIMRNSANDLGQRLTNLVKVSGDLMSGFSAVQGVMGLLGIESDGFERTLIRLQSAMAIVQGLEGLEGMIDHMKALRASFSGFGKNISNAIRSVGKWITSLVSMNSTTAAATTATNTMSAAQTAANASTVALTTSTRILSTVMKGVGFGAVTLAVGALITGISKLIQKNKEAKEAQEQYNESLKQTIESSKESVAQNQEEIKYLDMQLQGVTDYGIEVAKQEDRINKVQKELYGTNMDGKGTIEDIQNSVAAHLEALESLASYQEQTFGRVANQTQLELDAIRARYQALETTLEKEYKTLQVMIKSHNDEQDESIKDLEEQLDDWHKVIFNTIASFNLYGINADIVNIIDSWNNFYNALATAVKNGKYTVEQAAIFNRDVFANYLNEIDKVFESFEDNLKKGEGDINEYRKILQTTVQALLDNEFVKGNDSLAQFIRNWAQSVDQSLKEADGYTLAERIRQSNAEIEAAIAESDADFQKDLQEYLDDLNNQWIDEQIDKMDSGLADLTNRRISLLQQYMSLFEESTASLFSENSYFDIWLNDMNSAFSAASASLGDISSQFMNFFDEETGEIDFSKMKWEDWTATATMALNGVSDILGSYAASYKDQMEQILASDEATDEQKQEAVKKYKNMLYAQTAIDMLSGMTAAVATAFQLGPIAGPIVGAINAAMVLASGIASLTQIKAIDPMSENNVSGTGSASSTPNVSDVAINTDAYTSTLTAQSSYDLQGALDERSSDTRVYVLESDISETSKDVNTKVNESTF